jgi:hypothetical protein
LQARQLARRASRSIDEATGRVGRRSPSIWDVDAWSGIAGLTSQATRGSSGHESYGPERGGPRALEIDANDAGALLTLGRIASDYANPATAARHIEQAPR